MTARIRRSLAWAQIRYERGRAAATVGAVAVAVAAFVLLGSVAQGARLDEVAAVRGAYRPLYDILVRPPATADVGSPGGTGSTAVDQWAGSAGSGISPEQWHRVAATPGVAVAAPVAVGGYVLERVQVEVDLSPYLDPRAEDQMVRIDPQWSGDLGRSKFPDSPIFVYVTRDVLRTVRQGQDHWYGEQVRRDGSVVHVCPDGVSVAPLPSTGTPSVLCVSTAAGSTWDSPVVVGTDGKPRLVVDMPMPVLVAGIDPAQEDALDGLGAATVSGRALGAADSFGTWAFTRDGGAYQVAAMPVVVSSRSQVGGELRASVSAVDAGAVTDVATATDVGAATAGIRPGGPIGPGSFTVSADQVYRGLVQDASATPILSPVDAPDPGHLPVVYRYFTVGPTAVAASSGTAPGRILPAGSSGSSGPSGSSGSSGSSGGSSGSPGSAGPEVGWRGPLPAGDIPLRTVTEHKPSNDVIGFVPGDDGVGRSSGLALRGVGVFDPARLGTGSSLAPVPGDLAQAPGAKTGDGADGAGTLLPGLDIAGAVGQTPSVLTTLNGLAALRQSSMFADVAAASGVNQDAPITMLRVRVAGSVAADAPSRERVRVVADAIRQATGLRVDVVDGSSGATVPLTMPAGNHGRPATVIAVPVTRFGVTETVSAAVDRKSLLLGIVVLAACLLAVANIAAAAVRTRATQLGVLSCLGWPRRRLFGTVLAEAALLGVAAGALGAAAALAVAWPSGTRLRPDLLAGAPAAALLLLLCAALIPAWRASRADPAAAVRPLVVTPRRGRPHRRIAGLAAADLLRGPGRAVAGVLGVTGGVAALTLLVALDLGFHQAVTGTLLGQAVTFRARGADYAGAALALVLGAASTAEVVAQQIRDRAAEFALLNATGWSRWQLSRLAGYGALAMAAAGAALGAASGLAGSAAFAGRMPTAVILAAAGSGAVGIAVTIAAAAIPLRSLTRLAPARLLAEE